MNVTLPLVSVVVVNYTYGQFLYDCLCSIARQDYEYYECIVIDNASTDDSCLVFEATLAGLEDDEKRKFTLHRMPENLFQTGGCFAGLKLSAGSHIVFVDADDLLLPGCLTAHIRAHFACREGVGLTCGDMLQLSGNALVSCAAPGLNTFVQSKRGLRPERFRRLDESKLPVNFRPTSSAAIDDLLHYVEPSETTAWPYSATSAFCFRRDALELLFQYKPTMKGCTDAYMAHGVASLNGGVVIDAPVAAYRIHTTNIFARHAPLSNFYNFDVKTELQEVKRSIEEVIRSHLHNAKFIASHGKDNLLFFRTLESLALISDGLQPSRLKVSSYVLEFLIEHYVFLSDTFGNELVDRIAKQHCRSLRDRLALRRYLPRGAKKTKDTIGAMRKMSLR